MEKREISKADGEIDNEKIELFFHLKKISEINKQAGGLNDLFYEFAAPHLEYFCKLLNISTIAAALYANLAYLYRGTTVSIDQLADYIHLSCIEIIQYMGELETLEDKDLICIHKTTRDYLAAGYPEKIQFELRLVSLDLLRKGRYRDLIGCKKLSIEKFFLKLESLCGERVQGKKPMDQTIKSMKKLLADNKHLVFVQKIRKLDLQDHDTLVLLRFFHYTVNNDEPEMTFHHLQGLYDHVSEFNNNLKRKLVSGEYVLITRGLIKNIGDDGFGNAESFSLTDEVKEDFLVELDYAPPKPVIKELKSFNDIKEKQLFYPEKTQAAINELASLLQPKNFFKVRKRLSENNLRTGFACLFSGGPGTGKTETVYQIAKKCGRDIMQVDIASVKSKWFGESEKLLKTMFDKYRRLAKNSKIKPILLFNEADALITKRQILDENRNGPGQTENAIQNILLQEIEDLDGILIATTNLTKNMDSAFERRFLYKIEFEKPEPETRKAIWQSLFTNLSDDDAMSLAARFDFSGGQIENISRKTTVHRVLSGKEPVLDDMVKFCNAECIESDSPKRIGFVN